MSKAVLISIHPEWCEKIASGRKIVEIRKTRPKIDIPFKCYIYQTKHKWMCRLLRLIGAGNLADQLEDTRGKVIGEFICNCINCFKVYENGSVQNYYFADLSSSCLTHAEIANYIGKGNRGYSWRISDLVIYDKPKELSDFCTDSSVFTFDDKGNQVYTGMKRPPQSWCYVEELRSSYTSHRDLVDRNKLLECLDKSIGDNDVKRIVKSIVDRQPAIIDYEVDDGSIN